LSLLLICGSSCVRIFVETVFGGSAVIVFPMVVVVSVSDRSFSPKEIDGVLDREEVHRASSQNVRLVLGVDGIPGILENSILFYLSLTNKEPFILINKLNKKLQV
jgi:hypothetical protein